METVSFMAIFHKKNIKFETVIFKSELTLFDFNSRLLVRKGQAVL